MDEHLLNSACSQLDYQQVTGILESGLVKEEFGHPDDFSTNKRQFFHKLFGGRRYIFNSLINIFYKTQTLNWKSLNLKSVYGSLLCSVP